jgi:hypothetical protein
MTTTITYKMLPNERELRFLASARVGEEYFCDCGKTWQEAETGLLRKLQQHKAWIEAQNPVPEPKTITL